MGYKIIVDSCCELPEDFRNSVNTQIIPLGIEVGEKSIVDDDTFDQKEFIRLLEESPKAPSSHCPSPEKYMEAMKGDAERIYVITLSANLSGSYNSAQIGKSLFLEENADKKVYVFDSRSASCGETQIAFWVRELEEKGLAFEEIVESIEKKIDERRTYFVLGSLEPLRKAGRLTGLKAIVANTLNIRPVLAGTLEGTITQIGQARGVDKALVKLVDLLLKDMEKPEEKTLMISHCNCPERAQLVYDEVMSRVKIEKSLIIDTRGISSLYANDGGVIVTL